jgi:hypothetical protein
VEWNIIGLGCGIETNKRRVKKRSNKEGEQNNQVAIQG